jgi:hypothetical protein
MSGKEQLSLLNLKGKILFSDEVVSVRKLTVLLNGLLKNFTRKLFISKNDKIEAVILPIEEYEKMQNIYRKFQALK